MLMKISGPVSEEVRGGWRKLREEDFDESHVYQVILIK